MFNKGMDHHDMMFVCGGIQMNIDYLYRNC